MPAIPRYRCTCRHGSTIYDRCEDTCKHCGGVGRCSYEGDERDRCMYCDGRPHMETRDLKLSAEHGREGVELRAKVARLQQAIAVRDGFVARAWRVLVTDKEAIDGIGTMYGRFKELEKAVEEGTLLANSKPHRRIALEIAGKDFHAFYALILAGGLTWAMKMDERALHEALEQVEVQDAAVAAEKERRDEG